MPTHEQLYPAATPELAKERKRLAPVQADAFRAFSRSVFAEGALNVKTKRLIAVAVAEMRAGGAYAHSALALDTISHDAAA